MKRRIRLTESDLHRIVNSAVRRVLRESEWASGYGGKRGFNLDKNADDDEPMTSNNIGRGQIGRNGTRRQFNLQK